MTTIQVSIEVSLEVCDQGEGNAIVFIPSWARDIRDFDSLIPGLVEKGFRCVSVNPRKVGGSTGPTDNISLFDWAEDVVGVMDALNIPTAHIVGHGHGNRVARCLATRWEQKVERIVLLAPGGMINPSETVLQALDRALSEDVDDVRWCQLMRECGFFARNSDPMIWRTGWWSNVMDWQTMAGELSPCSEWWSAGTSAQILLLHGLEDTAAPMSNARLLKEKLPERVTLIALEDAGHALLPEVPDEIMQAVVDFLPG